MVWLISEKRDEFIPYIKSAYVSSNKGFEHKDFKSYLYDEQTTTLDDDVASEYIKC